ncbi:cysteine-rich CWC family protein [Ideonella sp. 4Y16]|uniref:Cysteine-rich CWC family protein n=1 Tax=Ideonella alba TaxID=2824118 RepID=A0A941BCT0_9BURK|nr:cysteine-rich CWC family protein [Ideonella alba]MBQ0929476.1 cysteine-rich CWC family protein [Ideonella alba]MBQ0944578.1 cysteine-rich CWC family protein [Ideonella alba]
MLPPVVPPLSTDRCPRCGGGFHCGAQDPGPCACTRLQLTPEVLQAMRARWTRCLCLACLQALSEGAPTDPQTASRPTQGD